MDLAHARLREISELSDLPHRETLPILEVDDPVLLIRELARYEAQDLCPRELLARRVTTDGLGGNGHAGEGAAKGSDTCKGRGSDTALCNAMFPYVGYPALCPEDAPYSSRLKKSYTATHYPSATGFGWAAGSEWADIRRDYGHRRWNKYGMFASVNSKKEPVEGVTHVTHANPQLGTTEFGQTTVMAGSGLKKDGTALRVNGACEVLFGKGVTTATSQSKSVSCGSDSDMTVTAYTDRDANADGVYDFCELTLTAAPAGALTA